MYVAFCFPQLWHFLHVTIQLSPQSLYSLLFMSFLESSVTFEFVTFIHRVLLILTLFCHWFASSSFFFLASSSWEIVEVSSASSVACMHARTHTHARRHTWIGREQRVHHVSGHCVLFDAARVCNKEMCPLFLVFTFFVSTSNVLHIGLLYILYVHICIMSYWMIILHTSFNLAVD